MAQFTAISGRKIPSALYSDGKYLSRIISGDLNKRRNHSDKGDEVQEAKINPSTSAPSRSTKLNTVLLIGTESPSTTVTATPRPNAVDTFLETARNVHMPRRKRAPCFQQTPRAQINSGNEPLSVTPFPAVQASTYESARSANR